MLEQILRFVTDKAEYMIQWLFFAILLLSGALIARGLFSKKEDLPAPGASEGTAGSQELQAALAKIMEQTAKLEAVKLGELSPAGLEQVNVEVEELKKDLQSKEDEIAKLKASGSSQAGADAGALALRIKELEAKLANYEILEDDIADLSKFKEENARLRQEIASLKVTGTAPADVSTVSAQESAAAPAGESKPALNVGGDPMADFEKTLKLEKELTAAAESTAPKVEAPAPVASAPAPVAEPTPPAEAAPASAAPATAESSAPAAEAQPAAEPVPEEPKEKDDIFAEFVAGPQEEAVDADKVLNELAAMGNIEASGESALNESLDTDKMVVEMKDLNKPS